MQWHMLYDMTASAGSIAKIEQRSCPEINAVWIRNSVALQSQVVLLNALLFNLICDSLLLLNTHTHTYVYKCVCFPGPPLAKVLKLSLVVVVAVVAVVVGQRTRSSYKDKYQQASGADRQSVCVCSDLLVYFYWYWPVRLSETKTESGRCGAVRPIWFYEHFRFIWYHFASDFCIRLAKALSTKYSNTEATKIQI